MLLHRLRGTGSVGRDELLSRADDFSRVRWIELGERECHQRAGTTEDCQD